MTQYNAVQYPMTVYEYILCYLVINYLTLYYRVLYYNGLHVLFYGVLSFMVVCCTRLYSIIVYSTLSAPFYIYKVYKLILPTRM